MIAFPFGFATKPPLILQTEATECDWLVSAWWPAITGHRTDLAALRRTYHVSLKGATLVNLIQIADKIGLASRPLKLDLNDMAKLKLPCILHWEFNHFVVLQEVGARSATIYDPAFGIRRISLDQMSKSFTGVALELWPQPGFQEQSETPPVKLRHLMGRVTGLDGRSGRFFCWLSHLKCFRYSIHFPAWVIDNAIVAADRNLITTLALGFGLLMLMQQAVSALRSWAIMYMGTSLNVQWCAKRSDASHIATDAIL